MEPSNRVSNFKESVTLKLNAEVVKLQEAGNEVINLTAGQLPFKPDHDFINNIKKEANFLKSFQYSPVPGFPELRSKILDWSAKERSIPSDNLEVVIANGAKQVLSNIFCGLINPGDEVIIIAPFWVSYPAMIELYGGKPVIIESDFYDYFCPDVDAIKSAITDKTKAIVINSPNNPVGTVYKVEWMKSFSKMIREFPQVNIVSDEIYKELNYYDPDPSYFYQFDEKLLERTVIVSGISKIMAATGLRLGWAIGPSSFIKKVSTLQGQIASGANSLIQQALAHYDFSALKTFLEPIKAHLRKNANTLRDKLREENLSHKWYQVDGAFYYLIDFKNLPIIEFFRKSEQDNEDYAPEICQKILTDVGVAVVPGSDFGAPNTGRISLVAEHVVFDRAVDLLINSLNQKQVN